MLVVLAQIKGTMQFLNSVTCSFAPNSLPTPSTASSSWLPNWLPHPGPGLPRSVWLPSYTAHISPRGCLWRGTQSPTCCYSGVCTSKRDLHHSWCAGRWSSQNTHLGWWARTGKQLLRQGHPQGLYQKGLQWATLCDFLFLDAHETWHQLHNVLRYSL